MGRITPRAAEKLRQTVQKVANLPPQGAGFADPGRPIRLAKTTVSHPAGETQDVRLWWGEQGDESEGEADRDLVPVYNRFADFEADEFIHIARVGPGWEIIGRPGAVRVIGPCVAYTPDVADPDTDFAEAYPGGCDGPDALGLNVKNLGTGVTSVVRLEVQSTGPLTFSSDTFSFSCASSTITVYAVVVFTDLDIEGVVATIYLDSDDSVVQAYTNTIYSWNPLAGGNLQMGPSSTSCDCGTLPYDLCLSIPTR